jgi:hypothetical protein
LELYIYHFFNRFWGISIFTILPDLSIKNTLSSRYALKSSDEKYSIASKRARQITLPERVCKIPVFSSIVNDEYSEGIFSSGSA